MTAKKSSDSEKMLRENIEDRIATVAADMIHLYRHNAEIDLSGASKVNVKVMESEERVVGINIEEDDDSELEVETETEIEVERIIPIEIWDIPGRQLELIYHSDFLLESENLDANGFLDASQEIQNHLITADVTFFFIDATKRARAATS